MPAGVQDAGQGIRGQAGAFAGQPRNDCTLRGGRAVLETPATAGSGIGEIQLQINGCALAPAQPGGLICLFGAQPAGELLAALRISGQGSIVSPEAAVALWEPDYGPPVALPEEQIEAAGGGHVGEVGENEGEISVPGLERA